MPHRTVQRERPSDRTSPLRSPAIDPAASRLLSMGPGDSIGFTYYDLQTNAAMPDRVINWPNASLPLSAIKSTAIWMASTDTPPATGNYSASRRGTYGAICDISSGTPEWMPMGGAWERRESVRTGFPEIGRLSDGRYVVANHSGTRVQVWVETTPGSNEWFQVDVPGSEQGLWVSMAVSTNDYVHVIWTYTTGHDQEDQVWYSRSTDGGESFSQAIALTGPLSVVTADLRRGFGANSYAIAANGDNVAVWYLTGSIEVLQLRSTDGGETWPVDEAAFVFQPTNTRRYYETDDPEQRLWPDPAFGADTAVGFRTDTVPGPGSSLDVLMDASGRTHGVVSIFPTYVRRYFPPGGDTTASTFRGGIIYQASHNYTDAGLLYLSEADRTVRRSFVPQPGGLVNGPNEPTYYIQRSYHGGWSLYPQLGLDAQNNVYLTFASGTAEDLQQARRRPDSAMKNWLLHHTFVTWMRSDDNEMRWMAPRNLTPNGMDAKYGALADLVDDELHIAYQIDPIVGEMIPDTLAPIARERQNVEVLFLQTSSLDNPMSVGETGGTGAQLGVSASPNPSVGALSVSYDVLQPGQVSLVVVDVFGRTVRTLVERTAQPGTYHLKADVSELAVGSYFLVLRNGGGVRTSRIEIAR